MFDSVQPHRRQPTRLPRSWDSPGKNTGVGCHFLLQCMKLKSESEVAQSCRTTLATPWTAAYQAPASMGFSRQKYWSGVPLPSPKNRLCRTIKWLTHVMLPRLGTLTQLAALTQFCLMLVIYLVAYCLIHLFTYLHSGGHNHWIRALSLPTLKTLFQTLRPKTYRTRQSLGPFPTLHYLYPL